MPTPDPIRIGILGARQGRGIIGESMHDDHFVVTAACDTVGRNPQELELTSLFRLNFDGGDLDEGEIGGSTEQVIDQIGQYAEVGLTHAALFVLGRGTERRLEAINRFAEDIAPNFS